MKKILIFTLAFILISLASFAQSGVKGNGNVIKITEQIPNFDKVIVKKAFNVYMTQGSSNEIIVEADENLHEFIEIIVKEGVLSISSSKNIRKAKQLNVYVQYQNFSALDVSGASDVEVEGTLKTNKFSIDVSGASDVSINLDVNKLNVDISGASDLTIKGNAKEMNAEISGASDFIASSLEVEEAKVITSGASDASINVSKKLVYASSGSSDLNVQGAATVTKIKP